MEDAQSVAIRTMRSEDAYSFLAVHHQAVRGLAADDYSPEIINEWAPSEISQRAVEDVIANRDGEIRIVAKVNGTVVGVGAVIPPKSELRACYVLPSAARKGIGTSLVLKLEQLARRQGAKYLELVSSTNAESFYAAIGYRVLERGEHILSTGGRMACVKMRKSL